jgi:AcrR family transcriptional regulator
VGQERRARTEHRILEVALEIFADHGADGPVIDDFVQAAGIARGTFYNHFKSVEALLQATSEATTRKVIEAIEASLQGVEAPSVRVGVGLRLFFAYAARNPRWSRFVARVWQVGGLELPLRDLDEGLRLGVFRVPSREVARDVLIGTVREALGRLGAGSPGPTYCDELVRVCFQALRANERTTTQAMTHPLPLLAALPGS